MRQLTGWTYAELAFHLADSMTYRAFYRVSALSALSASTSTSALAATLRRVSVRTLAALNDQLVTSAAARAVEPARTVRQGCDRGAGGDPSPDRFEPAARCGAPAGPAAPAE
ncbi:MAG: hypothetical protein Q8K82_09190 [Gemmatimonadaceae bacterium]|nr:hypothetical protein [Gemmatimonadaceae bacterium]